MKNNFQISEIIDRFQNLYPKKIDLKLERTLNLCKKLGSPHLNLPPTIHISGTNGKGSVAAFLRAIAEEEELKVHSYTSPHLCNFNERIRISGKLISNQQLKDTLLEVEKVNAKNPITFFEITTALGFLVFSRHPADLLILETGLGGIFDSTNIIENHLCSVITPISFDHEHFLGNDLSTIAKQKAGLMRPNSTTIWAEQHPIVEQTLSKNARKLNCKTIKSKKDFFWESNSDGSFKINLNNVKLSAPKPNLIGDHQYENASLAMVALIESGLIKNKQKSINGISRTNWHGRIQNLSKGQLAKISKNNDIWLDGAHNLHGAKALINTLIILDKRKWNVIFGYLNTRDPEDFINEISGITKKLITIEIPNQKQSISKEILKNIGLNKGINSNSAKNLEEALIKTEPNFPIIICGSLYLAGHCLNLNKTKIF